MMKPDETESATSRDSTAPRTDRRRFLAACTAVALTGLAGARLVFLEPAEAGPVSGPGKVTVTGDCVACTGCAAVCPVDAIRVTPGKPRIIDELCVSCGYCMCVCPVRAIYLTRERPGGPR